VLDAVAGTVLRVVLAVVVVHRLSCPRRRAFFMLVSVIDGRKTESAAGLDAGMFLRSRKQKRICYY